MTLLLRIELIILAVAAIVFVVHTVNKRILLLKYSLIWLLISLVLIIAACFPKIAFSVTALVGIETPSNLIFGNTIIAGYLFFSFRHRIQADRKNEKTGSDFVTGSL